MEDEDEVEEEEDESSEEAAGAVVVAVVFSANTAYKEGPEGLVGVADAVDFPFSSPPPFSFFFSFSSFPSFLHFSASFFA